MWTTNQAAEDHPCYQGGGDVDHQQPHPRSGTAQDPRADEAQEEGGAAVVGEAQQQLRLPPGELALPPELRGGLGPGGVSPQQSRQQRHGAGPAQTEQRAHKGTAQPLQPPGQPQPDQQSHRREEGEKGGDHRLVAQGQPLPDGGGDRLRPRQEPGGEGQDGQCRQQLLHSVTSPKSI